ncbi:MAG: TetR/AcrR family bet gene transcriptional repressor [Paracoccaceae bacterium]|jgi:TetR/AcrR family transcriptional repressor of bet genes
MPQIFRASPRPTKERKERKDNADMRRRQILDATLRSIIRSGLAKTTLATVAAESGLSQGVAVFYFKSKNGLLSAALRELYQSYEDTWEVALANAAPTPTARLRAIIAADFDPVVCNPDTLAVWFAFWGEQKFTPQYSEITSQYDQKRANAIEEICLQLLPSNPERARLASDWIDSATDGYWQKLHLFPESYSRDVALKRTFSLVQTLFADHAKEFGCLTSVPKGQNRII